MIAFSSKTADLNERRERLAREVAEIEAKAARLRESAAARRKTLTRLDAQLAMNGGDGRAMRDNG